MSTWTNPDTGRPTQAGEVTTGPGQSNMSGGGGGGGGGGSRPSLPASHWLSGSGGVGSTGIDFNGGGGGSTNNNNRLPQATPTTFGQDFNNMLDGQFDSYRTNVINQLQKMNPGSNIVSSGGFGNYVALPGGGSGDEAIDNYIIEQQAAGVPEQQIAQEIPQLTQDQASSAYQSAIDDLMGRQRGLYDRELQRRGLSPQDFGYVFEDRADEFRSGIPKFDPNNLAESYDLQSHLNRGRPASILDEYQQGRRSQYENQIAEFAPTDFQYNMVGDNFGQDALDQMLEERQRDAQQFLERGHQRGSLTDVGLNRSMAGLQDQRGTAATMLTDVGNTQRSALRDSLSQIAQQGRQGASGFQLGQSFDPGQYQSRIEGTFNTGQEEFGGRVRGALGDAELFNPQQLYNQAGQSKGMINPGRQAMIGAVAERERNNDRNTPRGLGNQGAF